MTPVYPQDLSDVVKQHTEEIAQLKAALSRRGKLNVVQGGTFDVLNADGSPLVRIGELAGYTAQRLYYPGGQLALYMGALADGTVQTLFYRQDGSLALRIGGSPGQPAFASFYDRSGNIVVSDDTVSGVGIATPYIPWGPFQSSTAPTDTTTSGTFVTLQTALGNKMNPMIWGQILGQASDGTTAGEIRVIDEDGTQIGGTITVAAGAFQYYTLSPTALPGTFKEAKSLNIQARRTAGAGTIGVRGIYAAGQQS